MKREDSAFLIAGALLGFAIFSFLAARDIHLHALRPALALPGTIAAAAPRWTDAIQALASLSLLPLVLAVLFLGLMQARLHHGQSRVTAIQFGILDASLREIRAANEMTREMVLAKARPWVNIAAADIAEGLTYDDSGARLSVRFTVRNVGTTMAADCWIAAAHCLWSSDTAKLGPDRCQAELAQRSRAQKQPSRGYTLFPGQELNESVGLAIPRREYERALRDREEEVHLWIVGCVNYADSSRREVHQTGFIYKLVRTDVERFRPGFETLPINIVPAEGDIPAASLTLQPDPIGSFAT